MSKKFEIEKVDDVFRDNRIVYMRGDFNEDKVQEIIQKMLELECDCPKKDILLYIDSDGGYVDSFIAIHDVIKMLRCDVATFCIGKAMSAGQLLLMSGTKGKRFISSNSRVMLHQLGGFTWGKLSDMESDIREDRRLQKILNSLILRYTNIKKKDLKKYMRKDSFFSAKKSVKLGLADSIVTDHATLYKKLKL